MLPSLAVFILPDPDDNFGIAERVKMVGADTSVSESAMERFDETASLGLLGRDRQ